MPEPAYSSNVRLWLDCAYGIVPLSQTGGTFVVSVEPRQVPPCEAQIVVSVDGHEYRRPVYLIHGITPDNPVVRVVDEAPF